MEDKIGKAHADITIRKDILNRTPMAQKQHQKSTKGIISKKLLLGAENNRVK